MADFEKFYQAYPRRVDRAGALKVWLTLSPSPELVTDIMAGVERYAESVADTEQRYIKHPAAWLNARRWEDESLGAGKSNGHPKPTEVKDRGDGFVEVDGQLMARDLFERRFANAAR